MNRSQVNFEEDFKQIYNTQNTKDQKIQVINKHCNDVQNKPTTQQYKLYENILNCLVLDSKERQKYETTDQFIEYLRNINITNLARFFTQKSTIQTIVQNCDDLDIISVLLREFVVSHKVINRQINQQAISELAKIFEDKILQFQKSNNLFEKFFTFPLKRFIDFKDNKISNYISKEELTYYIQKIISVHDNIIMILIDQMQNKNLIIEVLIQWLMIIQPQEKIQWERIDQISENLMKCCKKQQQYQVEQVQTMFSYMLSCLKIKVLPQDPIQIHMNLFLIITKIDEMIFTQLMEIYYIPIMYDLYQIDDIITILNNLLASSYAPQVIQFIQILSMRYLYDHSGRLDILIEIYKQFITKKIFNKLKCKQSFEQTYELLVFYIFGIQDFVQLQSFEINQLLQTDKYFKFLDQNQIVKYLGLLQAIIKTPSFISRLQVDKQQIEQFLQKYQSQYRLKELNEIEYQQTYQKYKFVKGDFQYQENLYKQITVNKNNFGEIQNNQQLRVLENLGNTCYMNSFLISLFMTKDFRKFVMNNTFKMYNSRIYQQDRDVFNQLVQCFFKILSSNENSISPLTLKQQLPEPFKSSFDQQDVTEFARIFLDHIEQFLNKQYNCNVINQMFFGQITNEIECQICQEINQKEEKIMELFVNFSKDCQNDKNQNYDQNKMMQNFFAGENLEQQNRNQYFCNKCKKHVPLATKNSTLNKLPPYLIVTINRFQYDIQLQKRIKLINKVDINLEFQLQDIIKDLQSIEGKSIYELYAAIIHLGSSAESGHYVTYARDLEQSANTWNCFDDSMGQVITLEANSFQVLEQNWSEYETPYMLFYQNKQKQPIQVGKNLQRGSIRTIPGKIQRPK